MLWETFLTLEFTPRCVVGRIDCVAAQIELSDFALPQQQAYRVMDARVNRLLKLLDRFPIGGSFDKGLQGRQQPVVSGETDLLLKEPQPTRIEPWRLLERNESGIAVDACTPELFDDKPNFLPQKYHQIMICKNTKLKIVIKFFLIHNRFFF